jgi:hypothetical protein
MILTAGNAALGSQIEDHDQQKKEMIKCFEAFKDLQAEI